MAFSLQYRFSGRREATFPPQAGKIAHHLTRSTKLKMCLFNVNNHDL